MRKVIYSTAIGAVLAVSVAGAFAAEPPTTTPNSAKYRDNGIKPATGRSGSASLQVRALIAKDLTTEVEATTGDLEAGTSRGNIGKTQVKIATNPSALNYNNLTGGGYWTATYSGVPHRTSVQVQANVSGIDPRRTDVVTTTTTTALRPDLAVQSLNGPAGGRPQVPVTFTATVAELNGDVGARADCVLTVNGTTATQYSGIWVDAGGTVSCSFSHTFTDPGTYAIGVSAANVNPGDWDTANNTATTSITIAAPGVEIPNGSLSAAQANYQVANWYRDGWGQVFTSDASYNYSTAYLSGWGDSNDGFNNLQRVDVTVSADGVTAHSASLVPNYVWDYDDGYYYAHCGQYYTYVWTGAGYAVSADQAGACSYGVHGWYGYSSYSYQLLEGTVVYAQTAGWWWVYQEVDTYGTGVDYHWQPGSAIRVQASFVDLSGTAHTVDRTVTLQDRSAAVNYDYSGCGWDCYHNTASGTYAGGDLSW